MKIYLFYQLGDDAFGLYSKPKLYAYTNNKEYAKEFKKVRNMDMFIEEVQHVDKSEYNQITSVFHTRGCQLVETKLLTSYENECIKTPVVITQHEEDETILRNETVYFELCKSTSINSVYFNDKIINALDTLYYFDIMKQYSAEMLGINYSENNSMIDVGLQIDQLQYFILKFGHTMR